MSDPITIIEESVESAIYAAIKVNLDALAGEITALQSVLINGLFMPDPDTSGSAGKRRDMNGPRINITCNPNIPIGFQSVARSVKLDIHCITQPDSDPDHRLAVYCYRAVRKVFDNNEFSLPSDAMELRGYLVTDGSAGITEEGFVVSFGVSIKVFIKQKGV